ncbi:MAG: hypothetical protein ABEJ79_11380 [Halolamina sp.]
MTERRERADGCDAARGQLSLSVVEAAVGVLFVLGVTASFGLSLPAPSTTEAQLDAYAEDAGTVLATEPPRHADATRLTEVCRSADAFERERGALADRTERVLPDNLLFRIRTPHGTVGFRPPTNAPTGIATAPIPGCDVTIRVWYA